MLETFLDENESIFWHQSQKGLCRFVSQIAKQGFVKVRVDGKITTSPPE
jgi:hypothetical protein